MFRLFIRVVLLLALPGLSLAVSDMPKGDLSKADLTKVDLAKLVQLVDYVGVDYRGAVHEGRVINPAEYDEMRDFTHAIEDQARQLPISKNTTAILASAGQLTQMVEQRQAPVTVAAEAAELRHSLIGTFNITVIPRMPPDIQRARQLFSDNCAACHGLNGQGDGVQARGMEPAPTDFTDAERYGQRTVYGLYSTISAGVGDTGMRGFSELSEADRWSLAFLVGQMATTVEARAAGKTVIASQSPAKALVDLKRFTVTTPDEARAAFGAEGVGLMAYLRAQPESLFDNASPLDYARDTLDASLDAYRSGQRETAYKLAVAAYLEGFELVEHRLDTIDSELRGQVETAMTAYRNLLRSDNPLSVVEAQATEVQQLLVQVGERLSEGTLSTGAAFASAFIILLREGLEAILVIAALAAFLIKTERRDAMPYLHYGWVSALALGFATWIASLYLFDISGANREITEGVAALVAMVVLFYVGFWMHSKTSALQWQRFIDGSVKKALGTGTLWGLTALSFIAVFREVFETILFYQALWVQADAPAQGMLLSGLGAGMVVLAVLSWLILRYSTRLPLRQFFSATGIFMFALAVVFAGKGIAALQEAGKLPLDPISFPRIDLLGIYPNLQGLAVQSGLLILATLILWGSRLKQQTAAT